MLLNGLFRGPARPCRPEPVLAGSARPALQEKGVNSAGKIIGFDELNTALTGKTTATTGNGRIA
jgi:hypothetical protein